MQRLLLRLSDLLAGAWAVVIGWLSLSPSPPLPPLPVSDKLEHFAAYLLLGALATLKRKSLAGTATMVLLIATYGGAIELLQPYNGRLAEWGDLLANITGCLAGALLSIGYSHRCRRGTV